MSEPPFEPPGEVLFRVWFRVNLTSTTAADFNRLIERVERELRDRIEHPRLFGNSETTMLPPSRHPRRWFVIELQSLRDQETYDVQLFIEAETIYLRGYQNQHGQVFEFKQDDGESSYLTCASSPSSSFSQSQGRRSKPTQLSFSCNYNSIVRCTQQTGGNHGVTLAAAGYDRHALQTAIQELAQGRNPAGESQHTTAQNLLRVIVRFCESIRFRTIRREMVDLWITGGSLSSECLGQINNWSCIGRNLVDSHRNATFVWSGNLLSKTGVGSPAMATEVVALVPFCIPDPDTDNSTTWKKKKDDDPASGGGGGGGGGSSWGVLADEEPPRLYTMPEEPVMEILSVCTPRQGIYGRITVTDGFGAQTIYQRSRDKYQSPAGDDSNDATMMLELDAQKRAIPAYDCVDIDVDLYDASTQAPVAAGHMSWNSCDFEANSDRYNVTTRWDVGDGVVLEYIVYSKAVQVAVSVTLDNGGARGRGWFTTRNTMMGTRRSRPMYAGTGDDHLLRGHHVAAVPIGFNLQVAVGFEHEAGGWGWWGSRLEPVQLTVEQVPRVGEGIYTVEDNLQDGSTAKVSMVWNLLRKEPPTITQEEDPTTTPQDPATGSYHDEL